MQSGRLGDISIQVAVVFELDVFPIQHIQATSPRFQALLQDSHHFRRSIFQEVQLDSSDLLFAAS
jgi:hypothetical protein